MNPLKFDRGAALAGLRTASPASQWAVDTSWRRTPGGRYFLQVKIRDVIVEALYDPSSEITVIRQDVFNLIKHNGKLETIPVPCILGSASSSASMAPMTVQWITCSISCMALTAYWDMVIESTPESPQSFLPFWLRTSRTA